MPTHRFGSRPIEPYSYEDFVRHLAPHLPADDEVFRCDESVAWRQDVCLVTLHFFRSICHWKLRNQLPWHHICENTLQAIHNRLQGAIACFREGYGAQEVRNALGELRALSGVGVPVASALLTAWNPREFGIIDRRTCEVLGLGSSTGSATQYVRFLGELRELRQQIDSSLALRQIELAIWHYHAIQSSGEKQYQCP